MISRESVIGAFVEYLNRQPESEDTIRHYMNCRSEDELKSVLTSSKEYFQNKFSTKKFEDGAEHKILIVGSCQGSAIGRLITAMSRSTSVVSIELIPANYEAIKNKKLDISRYVEDSTLVILQSLPDDPFNRELFKSFPGLAGKMMLIPTVSYAAFHPDISYVKEMGGSNVSGPMGDYHSMIAFWAWRNGLSVSRASSLFRYDVFSFLGYFEYKSSSDQFMIELGLAMGVNMEPLLRKWTAAGCFMHTLNHPKIIVIADLARLVLDRLNVEYVPGIEDYVSDDLADPPCWPVYPDIGKKYGLPGSFIFKQARHRGSVKRPVPTLSLEQFLAEAYSSYNSKKGKQLVPLTASEKFAELDDYLRQRENDVSSPFVTGNKFRNPYAKLKNYQLWRRALEAPQFHEVDPVVFSTLQLTVSSKVATAGSCFAQHISRALSSNGFTYYVSETGEAVAEDKEEREKLNYGVYSARYGNLYTSRQLIQLFDRAYGKFVPIDDAWLRKDGRYVDPFRPMINPDGYATEAEVEQDRIEHLKHVRNMFESLDIFVFTLGLTESWRRREDGAVFPLAPGVAGGGMDDSRYEFVNFETHDIAADLEYFLGELAQINPAAKVIFTISPVPLVATYENRHVLTSTTYSKSALRSAADYVVRRYPQAEYFPSYEIITGNYNKGAYFETDLRSVREEGVCHVMRLFMEHYSSESVSEILSDNLSTKPDVQRLQAAAKINSVVCEEEALDSGFSDRGVADFT